MTVAPERLGRWLDGFAARHGAVVVEQGPEQVFLRAADGVTATVVVPFPPLTGDLVAHALARRRIGVLLVRLGGHAAGVFDGDRLVASKVGTRLVHGRSAAGGQSQQRFARRREGQVRIALAAAADTAARVLLPATDLDAVVLGGDRRALDAVLADLRLQPLRALVSGPVLDVPDPRLRVLQHAPFRDVRIRLSD